MQEAIALAERGRYGVAPNPLVGCVIVREGGEVVGRGWHQRAGMPHAEIHALNEAGERAYGAEVYVTLEPCSHHGRTPPCAEALIAARVKAVHIPFLDPDPRVQGRGVAKLRAAGIEVHIGDGAEAAREQNKVFLHHAVYRRPYVIAKWAMSLDGRIAAEGGETTWISGVPARRHAHHTRCWLGAVLVGVGTVLADNPRLTPHLINVEADNLPARVVLDSTGRTPLSAHLLNDAHTSKTLIATTHRSTEAWRAAIHRLGAAAWVLPADATGRVDIEALLSELGARGISGLLVEGGRGVLTSFVRTGHVEALHIYVGQKLLGGRQPWTPLGDLGVDAPVRSRTIACERVERVGEDVFMEVKVGSGEGAGVKGREERCLQAL